ncbi:hypothetical protein BgiMline_012802 [Biomphalaria glabrata]
MAGAGFAVLQDGMIMYLYYVLNFALRHYGELPKINAQPCSSSNEAVSIARSNINSLMREGVNEVKQETSID